MTIIRCAREGCKWFDLGICDCPIINTDETGRCKEYEEKEGQQDGKEYKRLQLRIQ